MSISPETENGQAKKEESPTENTKNSCSKFPPEEAVSKKNF